MAGIKDVMEHFGSRTFLLDGQHGGELTYAGFSLAVHDLADALSRAGVDRGTRIAAFLPSGIELACFYFACMALGAVAVPVNAKHPEKDREYILEVSRALIGVCQDDTLHLFPKHWRDEHPVFLVDQRREDTSGAWRLPREAFMPSAHAGAAITPDPNAPFTLTFTSGTTGRPKGIFHSVETLLTNAQAFNRAQGVSDGHRFLHAMPMSYMAGLLNCLLCPFAAGSSVVICREFDARMAFSFWDTVIAHQVNCLWSSPSALSMILQMDRGTRGESYAREHMHFIASCTASLPEQVRTDFTSRYGVPVLPSFGLSETLINTIDQSGAPCPPGSTGYPLPGIKIRVCGQEGHVLPAGQEGELSVYSPSLMLGYLDPETGLPGPVPDDGWFATGDMGLTLPGGALCITDRMKDIIVRGGVNVSPKKVEEALMAHGGVLEAAVVGIPDPLRGEKVVAALRTHDSHPSSGLEQELLAFLAERLEPMAIPEAIRRMDDFPRSSTGKVDKRSLRAMLEGLC